MNRPLKDLRKEYAAMAADVRNSEVGEALRNEINRRSRTKKVGIVASVAEALVHGQSKGILVKDGEVRVVDIEAIQTEHMRRQSLVRDLKAQLQPIPMEVRKVGANRNQPCPCGSGKKFKKCCFFKDEPIHITP